VITSIISLPIVQPLGEPAPGQMTISATPGAPLSLRPTASPRPGPLPKPTSHSLSNSATIRTRRRMVRGPGEIATL
jgi:hypothetical protein